MASLPPAGPSIDDAARASDLGPSLCRTAPSDNAAGPNGRETERARWALEVRALPPALHLPREREIEEDRGHHDEDDDQEGAVPAHGQLPRALGQLRSLGGGETGQDL